MKGITLRVKEALSKDSSIVIGRAQLGEAAGYTLEYMESLGLRESDLKKLERNGLAARGYITIEKRSSVGSLISKRKPMWILLGDRDQDETRRVL